MKMLWPEAHRNLTLYFLWEQCFSKSLIHYLYWPYRIYCEQTQVHWRALPSSESTIGSQWCSGTVPIRMPFGRNYPCWRSHVSWVSMSESFGKANSLQGSDWVLACPHPRHLQSESMWLTRETLASRMNVFEMTLLRPQNLKWFCCSMARWLSVSSHLPALKRVVYQIKVDVVTVPA